MKQGFMLTDVQCHACKWAVQVQPNILPTVAAIQACGSELHKKSGLICGEPRLIMVYVNVVFSNKLVDPQNAILSPNGNGPAPPKPGG
jgi:hypothetical protein